ncbi:hypothetical protein HPB47_019004 [Ixodes persulcatus]|uniref:Uncharacterized protein n=1 Tax=Ixodes persulcatus TaxID=34615 RepID=A0AC60QJB5_IXOPE|nr:hypothetical protein HPB47_019004 [Ixodes persulcatus]
MRQSEMLLKQSHYWNSDWSRTSIQLTEFLWNQVRPNLPSKKKQRAKEGSVLVLGNRPVAEQHRQIFKLGPKFCFEPALKRVDKLALSRLVSCQVPEQEKLRGLRALVFDKEGFFVIVPEEIFAEKAACAVEKNFKAVLERPTKVKERAAELLERLNRKQVGRLEDAGFPDSVIASATEAIVKSIKVPQHSPAETPKFFNRNSKLPLGVTLQGLRLCHKSQSSVLSSCAGQTTANKTPPETAKQRILPVIQIKSNLKLRRVIT